MADISAAMVMELRKMSGQGMMDCKKALQETDGDVQKAMDLLRKKGLATMTARRTFWRHSAVKPISWPRAMTS
ncbi:MAG: hypothetical protein ACYSWQ_14830 [Planctomycetota bacterium]|jgi:elongation factor Ts